MAEQVRIDLIAEDKASKPIDQLAAKVADLEDDKVKIPVTADTDAATHDIAGLMTKVDRLSRDPATLLLTTNATKIAGQITDLTVDLDKLDAADPTVEVKSEQINQLTGDLDKIETKLREVNQIPVDIDAKPAVKSIDDIGKSAGSSKSVLANMIGNSVQDVGALGGVAGSAGVALGQMGEYMADAAADGDGLRTVLRNFATVAGPIAALTVVVGTLSNFMARSQAEAAASAARVKQFGDALEGASGGADKLGDSLKQNRTMLTQFDAEAQGFGDSIVEGLANVGRNIPILDSAIGDAGQGITDLIPIMRSAGITADEFAKAVESGGLLFGGEWTQKLLDANAAGKVTDDQLAALSDSIHKFGGEATKAKDQNEFFNGSLEDQARAASDSAYETAQLAVNTDRARRAATDAARAWDDLSGSLDIAQQVADLGSSFDDLKAKAVDSWNKTKTGADDAKAAQNDYANAVRTAKSDVVDLGRQIGVSIPDVKKMLLQIDNGNLEDVQRQLDIMARNRTMQLSIVAKGGSLAHVGGIGDISLSSMPAPTPTPTPVPVTNVSITMPRGLRAGDVMREADRYARRNGSAHARRR